MTMRTDNTGFLLSRAGIADRGTSTIDAFVSFGSGGGLTGRARRADPFGIRLAGSRPARFQRVVLR